MRLLTYAQAIREAHAQLLASDPRVFVIGQGLWSPWYAGGTLKDLDRDFGASRMMDTPVSENAVTGAAVGAALAGMRPIVFHPRMDFMVLAMDPIINQAANWSYLFGGQAHVPLVVRAVINRGGEQGAQHSQALQAFFMHVPGLKVVMPATPRDAKGLLVSAVRDGNPVVYIDDRWLYDEVGPVEEDLFAVPIGRAAILKEGRDVTLVASSYMVKEALHAAQTLAVDGILAEVVDLRSIKPWDQEMVCSSVEKTGRLVVADGGWRTCGVSAEITATVSRELFRKLRAPVERVALPDLPAPTSESQEKAYYPRAQTIVRCCQNLIKERMNHDALRPVH